MIGELFDRQRDELVRPNDPGQSHQEHDGKTGNDSFHIKFAAGVLAQLVSCVVTERKSKEMIADAPGWLKLRCNWRR